MRARSVLLGICLLGWSPHPAEAATSDGRGLAERLVAVGEKLVILDSAGEAWQRAQDSQDGVWRRAEAFGGDWWDLGVDEDRLILLRASGVYEATIGSPPRRLFNAPDGAYALAPVDGGVWMAGGSSDDRTLVLWYWDRETAEISRLQVEVGLSPFEERELATGTRLERTLFNSVILVPVVDGGVRAVFELRDILVECRRTGCKTHRWRSPRSRLMAEKPLRRNLGRPPMSRVARAVGTASADEIVVLPLVTDWDPETGSFDQRDEVIRLDGSGQVLETCPLPGRGESLLHWRGKIYALLESGRLTVACD